MSQEKRSSLLKSFKMFLLIFLLGGAIGSLITIGLTSPNSANNEQKKTDAVLADVVKRDSLVLVAQGEAMYYKEISDKMRLKLDSVYNGAAIRLADIDTLVHTNFESLPDSAKLAYREKVLARLRANQ